MRAINAWIPLMIFAFLSGLSMDYEVFMLTRMRKTYDETGSTAQAIGFGLARTGKLGTSAALRGRAVLDRLAAGIVFDATVIRTLLVPPVMRLLCQANWWMPDWARKALFIRQPEVLPKVVTDNVEEGSARRA